MTSDHSGGGRPARERWRDWLIVGAAEGVADPELITRDQLLATVERWGVKRVSERTLRFWEDVGILPRATIEGEPGRQRAMYPWWVADLIAQVRQYQDRGLDIEQMRGRIRWAAMWLSLSPSSSSLLEEPEKMSSRMRTWPDMPPDYAEKLAHLLSQFGVRLLLQNGVIPEQAEVRFHTTTGEVIPYRLPIKPLATEPTETIHEKRRDGDTGGMQ